MIDIILYDLDGAYCPPNLSAPVGGSEVELYQLHEAFNRAGIRCELITKRPDAFGGKLPIVACKRLIYWRQVEPAPWCDADGECVRATDAKPDGYEEQRGLTTVCVSKWQASAFKTPTMVIPPMLGPHVALAAGSGTRWVSNIGWAYASAANKGLAETLRAWRASEHYDRAPLYVTTTGYDEPEPGACEEHGAIWLGKLSPVSMVRMLSQVRGMFYRNVAPETFGVTTAIAVKLGLELDIECVGHEACGLAESRVPQDLSEATVVKRWMEVLGL
jgi:hypothetical protein